MRSSHFLTLRNLALNHTKTLMIEFLNGFKSLHNVLSRRCRCVLKRLLPHRRRRAACGGGSASILRRGVRRDGTEGDVADRALVMATLPRARSVDSQTGH